MAGVKKDKVLNRLNLPNEPGVYRIRCSLSEKSYIGSAGNIAQRIHTHRLDLYANRHENPYLQNAWNLYGPDAFTFEVIELTAIEQLLDVEQAHIDQGTVYPNGYNINPIAGATPRTKKPATHTGFIRPDGKLTTITDLKGFCREHGLDTARMYDVLNGKARHHHGWTYSGAVFTGKKRQGNVWYGYIDPNGESVVIDTIKRFCRENNLDVGSMDELRRPNSRRKQHKGWTYNPDKERQPG